MPARGGGTWRRMNRRAVVVRWFAVSHALRRSMAAECEPAGIAANSRNAAIVSFSGIGGYHYPQPRGDHHRSPGRRESLRSHRSWERG